MRKCEKNSPADTEVSEEGGGGCAPGTESQIPLQPMEKTVVLHVVPTQEEGDVP